MITKLRLINYKSHKDSLLEFKNLTILSGQNGVGKSSIFQSLLLLRQSHQKGRLDKVLDLNSPLCFIGKGSDAIYKFSDEEFENEIHIVLQDNFKEYSWGFEISGEKTFIERINDLPDSEGYELLSLFNSKFQYLSANRGLEYDVDDYTVEVENQISIIEGKGELTAQYLNVFGNRKRVISDLKHPSEDDDFLLSQVSAWEKEISSNVNVETVKQGNGYDVKYSFDTDNPLGKLDELSKKNVGFGLSYVLPILVAILSAEKDSLILIENPEAHIHPYGISKLTELICLASQAGIQIIVETHSDHVINGVLVQSKNNEEDESKGINRENVKIYHFTRNEEEHRTISNELLILEGGRIFKRIDGFFDQIGKDIRKLI